MDIKDRSEKIKINREHAELRRQTAIEEREAAIREREETKEKLKEEREMAWIEREDIKEKRRAEREAAKEERFAAKERRRTEREKLKGSPDRKMRMLKNLAFVFTLLVVLSAAVFLFISVMVDNENFEVTFYRVSSDKLKNNMRTVLVCDNHLTEYGAGNSELLDMISMLKPDFISVAGDLNTSNEDGLEYVRGLCEAFVKIAPTYYALGNHELNEIVFNNIDYKTAITETGVTLLHNKSVTTSINGNDVVLGGTSQRYNETESYAPKFFDAFLSKEGYRILITHFPESFMQGLEYLDIDLALAGHAHGGQIRLPFIGALYAPDQGLFPDLTEGLIDYDYISLIISRGLGNSSPIPRINNKPELVVVDMCTY